LVATIADVARIIAELPEVMEGEQHGHRTWSVGGKGFAWVRPFSKADIRRYGATPPPDGPILALRTADLAEKEAALATASEAIFTIPHFNGYAAVLVQLNKVKRKELRDAIVDAWFACAPRELADTYKKKRS
jgi:hypothetical protein